MFTNEPIEVGQRIRSIRKNLGLSMTEFAKRIDTKAKSGTVSNWETGKNLPNNERLKKIANIGNVSIEYLLNGITDLAGNSMEAGFLAFHKPKFIKATTIKLDELRGLKKK